MSGPSEEFSNTERISLIHGLEKWYGKPVAIEAWACLWLSDLEKLRQFVDGKRTPGWAISLVFREGNLLDELVKPCMVFVVLSYCPQGPSFNSISSQQGLIESALHPQRAHLDRLCQSLQSDQLLQPVNSVFQAAAHR
jgi:hypothetical protein